jgi:hypothetical protein
VWVIIQLAPTIDVARGLRVVIYSKDHPPPHVHVRNGDGELRVYLGSGLAVRKWGRMTVADARNAMALVAAKRETYRAEWDRIDPKS